MLETEAFHGVFEAVYGRDRWSNGSGPGSLPSSTIEYRTFVERFMHENRISTVPCAGARGAVVLVHHPSNVRQMWRDAVFLLVREHWTAYRILMAPKASDRCLAT